MVCQYAALLSTFARSSATIDGPRDALCQLEEYSWPTCSKQPRFVGCRIGVVNKLDRRRRRRVLLTTLSICRGEIDGEVRSLGHIFPGGSTLIFWRYPNFFITQCEYVKESFHIKTSSIRPVVSIQYRLVTERRTDRRTHDDSIYRASR